MQLETRILYSFHPELHKRLRRATGAPARTERGSWGPASERVGGPRGRSPPDLIRSLASVRRTSVGRIHRPWPGWIGDREPHGPRTTTRTEGPETEGPETEGPKDQGPKDRRTKDGPGTQDGPRTKHQGPIKPGSVRESSESDTPRTRDRNRTSEQSPNPRAPPHRRRSPAMSRRFAGASRRPCTRSTPAERRARRQRESPLPSG